MKRTSLFIFIIVVSQLMLAAHSLQASIQVAGDDKMCTVTGKVVDGQGRALGGTLILLQGSRESQPRSSKTDGNGAFSLRVAYGSYRVTFRRDGYYQKIDVWKFDAAQAKEGIIALSPVVLELNTQLRSLPPDLTKSFQEVMARMRRGSYEGAVEVLKKVVDLYPKDADMLYMLGVAYNKRHMPTEALVVLKRASELKPDFPGTLYEIGIAYHSLNQVRPALDYYEKALKLAPDRPEIHFNAGLILFNLNMPREALSHFKLTLLIKKDDAAALEMAGRCHLQMGMYPPALECLQKARALATDPQKIKELDEVIGLIKARSKF